MDLGLRNKRALVLAGTSGLGRATAQALANDGARVIINSRSAERAEDVAAQIAQAAGATEGFVRGLGGDVTQRADLERLVPAAVEALGGLDLVVINAGGPKAGGFEELSDEDWLGAFELTLMSAVRTVRLALPHLRAAGGGSVVAIGSSSIRQAVPGLTLSNSVRPGVNALFRELATTFGPEGIRFNMLSPGRIVTPRLDALDEKRAAQDGTTVEAVRAGTARTIPLGRLGRAEEFGRVAAFLLSDAASYLTGQSLLVDGGLITAI
ncbi:MAG: SDR family oxidoreductase [Trueperaceae bacterium]